MLRMPINQEIIEHPIKCTACGEQAAMLFFERLKAHPELGVIAALRKLYAKCWDCLSLPEVSCELVED